MKNVSCEYDRWTIIEKKRTIQAAGDRSERVVMYNQAVKKTVPSPSSILNKEISCPLVPDCSCCCLPRLTQHVYLRPALAWIVKATVEARHCCTTVHSVVGYIVDPLYSICYGMWGRRDSTTIFCRVLCTKAKIS